MNTFGFRSLIALFPLLGVLAGCADVDEANQGDEEVQLAGAENEAPGAQAAGWTWQYLSNVLSESYRISYNGGLRGVSTTDNGGSKIHLKDTSGDGLGQRLYWRVQGAAAWNVCDGVGGNDSTEHCAVTNGRFIQYQFCMKDGGTVVACAPMDGFQN